jgi:O-antigen/teichoic acid export membrane protein
MEAPRAPVSRRASVASNSLWSLAGQSAPLLLAAVAIPILIRQLGVDRFGVLSLAWILVGYLSLFDLGIGRATTKLLAETIARGDSETAASLIWTANFSMTVLGLCVGGALFALAPWLTHSALKIPLPLQSETARSLCWLAVAVPFVTLTCGLRGMLEAQHNFRAVGALRAGLGAMIFLGPLAVLPFSRSLVSVVITLVVARLLSCGLHWWLCMRSLPMFSQAVRWDRRSFARLLGFGGWLTLSNIISPVMLYLDRFLIGSLVSISAVAYYTTPSEIVTKLWVLPTAVAGVLFPAFSEALALDNQDRAASLYENGVGSTFIVLFPSILMVILFAHEGLRFWLGDDFARDSAAILRILAIGVFANSLANIPYALLQASGRPDLTAKLHLIELPCYVGLLYGAIRFRGIDGAALAWSCRLCAEGAILFCLARLVAGRSVAPRLAITIAVSATVLLAACLIAGLLVKIVFLAAALATFGCVIWRWTLHDFQRLRLRSWLKAIPVLG